MTTPFHAEDIKRDTPDCERGEAEAERLSKVDDAHAQTTEQPLLKHVATIEALTTKREAIAADVGRYGVGTAERARERQKLKELDSALEDANEDLEVLKAAHIQAATKAAASRQCLEEARDAVLRAKIRDCTRRYNEIVASVLPALSAIAEEARRYARGEAR